MQPNSEVFIIKIFSKKDSKPRSLVEGVQGSLNLTRSFCSPQWLKVIESTPIPFAPFLFHPFCHFLHPIKGPENFYTNWGSQFPPCEYHWPRSTSCLGNFPVDQKNFVMIFYIDFFLLKILCKFTNSLLNFLCFQIKYLAVIWVACVKERTILCQNLWNCVLSMLKNMVRGRFF